MAPRPVDLGATPWSVSHPWWTSVLHSAALLAPAAVVGLIIGTGAGEVLAVLGLSFSAGVLILGLRRSAWRRRWLAALERGDTVPPS